MANTIQPPKQIHELPLALIKNFITLSTGGLGVAVALAWNEAIKGAVQRFVDPYFGAQGTTVSLFIYAGIITTLAVIVTMQLTKIEEQLTNINNKINNKNKISKKPSKKRK